MKPFSELPCGFPNQKMLLDVYNAIGILSDSCELENHRKEYVLYELSNPEVHAN